jgi:prefoldin subunit 5
VDENGREIVEVGSHRRGIVEELEKAHIYIEQLNDQINDLKKQLAKFTAIEERLDQLETKANGSE